MKPSPKTRQGLTAGATVLVTVAAVGNIGHTRQHALDLGQRPSMALVIALLPDVMLILCVLRLRIDRRSAWAWIGLAAAGLFVAWASIATARPGLDAQLVAVAPLLAAVIASGLLEGGPTGPSLDQVRAEAATELNRAHREVEARLAEALAEADARLTAAVAEAHREARYEARHEVEAEAAATLGEAVERARREALREVLAEARAQSETAPQRMRLVRPETGSDGDGSAARVLAALRDTESPQSPRQIEEATGLSKATVSRRLAQLRQAGAVTVAGRGLYTAAPPLPDALDGQGA